MLISAGPLPNLGLSFLLSTILATTNNAVHCQHSQPPPKASESVEAGPRILSVRAGSQIYGELLVSMPLTIFLPTLRRSFTSTSEFSGRTLATRPPANSTMEVIFDTLEINSVDCQKRFICQALASPKRFEPLSDIFYILLRDVNNGGGVTRNRNKYILEKFKHYREGFVAGRHAFSAAPSGKNVSSSYLNNCVTTFPFCLYEDSAERMLDFNILKYWQKISDKLPLTISV